MPTHLMIQIGLIITIGLSHRVLGQRTPTISYIDQKQIQDVGNSVDLRCSVLYAQDYPVAWIKVRDDGTQLPLSSGNTLVVRDSRFSLRHDVATSTYTLQIKDLQETDAGQYECRIALTVNTISSAFVTLQVLRSPFISDNSTRSQVVSENQRVTLECYAGGSPIPKISWRRHNNAILPTGGLTFRGNILNLPPVRKEDRGTYYCIAENGVGEGARRHINLEIEFAPVVTMPRPRLGQALQFDMDLACHVEAYPPPAISWHKDDVLLSNNQHHSISFFATADEYTDSTIHLITIEKRQYGNYVCRAANKLGVAEATIELFETIIPICPPACGSFAYGAGNVETSSGTVITFAILIPAILKNLYTKY